MISSQVEAVVKQVFPDGTEGIDPATIFLAVHDRLRGQN